MVLLTEDVESHVDISVWSDELLEVACSAFMATLS